MKICLISWKKFKYIPNQKHNGMREIINYDGPEIFREIVSQKFTRLVEALEALGVKINEVSLRGREITVNRYMVLYIVGEIVISEKSGLFLREIKHLIGPILRSINDEIQREVRPVGYYSYIDVDKFRLSMSREQEENRQNIVVDVPEEYEKEVKRVAKGIAIFLSDNNVNFDTLVISGYLVKDILKIRVVLMPVGEYEEDKLEKLLRGVAEKYTSYLRERGLKAILDDIEVITTKIKPWVSIALKRKRLAEREASQIVSDEDIQLVVQKFRGKLSRN